MAATPFGSWPSPLSPESLATVRVSWSGLQIASGACWWSESRPGEGGRQAVLSMPLGADRSGPGTQPGPVSEVLGPDANVRSRVHEYGGGAFRVGPDGSLTFVDADEQALWWRPAGGAARRITPPAPETERHRYAEPRPVPGAPFVVVVRERHHPGGVDDEIVAVPVGLGPVGAEPGGGAGPVTVLFAGRDFCAAPRPSPDGARLAFIVWDHPNMPWDGTELLVADLQRAGIPALGPPTTVAGGPDESVGQPLWASADELWFVSDAAGWWQPYRWRAGTAAARVVAVEAEFHGPDWNLGQQTMAFLDDGRLACRYRSGGRDRVGVVRPGAGPDGGVLDEVDQPCVSVSALAAGEGRLVVVGATPTEPTGLVEIGWPGPVPVRAGARPRAPLPSADPRRAAARVLHRPGAAAPGAVSVAEPVRFATRAGVDATVLFYPPAGGGPGADDPGADDPGADDPGADDPGADDPGADGAPPPLLVVCHGGPTAANDPGYDPAVQFWTSRGIAVAAVDYRGSSGYGRRFRRLLDGAWGVADAEDCADAASHLARQGRVDAGRMAVRGASSGGLTALRAATVGGPFAAAVVVYGVTDLAALAADTHKFEARYIDRLVGPWPAAASTYEDRSPARHPERIGAALLLLQGADDAVVPPDQAARLADAVRRAGGRCEHQVFPGEGHGFRRAETLAACARAELAFLGSTLGFTPAP